MHFACFILIYCCNVIEVSSINIMTSLSYAHRNIQLDLTVIRIQLSNIYIHVMQVTRYVELFYEISKDMSNWHHISDSNDKQYEDMFYCRRACYWLELLNIRNMTNPSQRDLRYPTFPNFQTSFAPPPPHSPFQHHFPRNIWPLPQFSDLVQVHQA